MQRTYPTDSFWGAGTTHTQASKEEARLTERSPNSDTTLKKTNRGGRGGVIWGSELRVPCLPAEESWRGGEPLQLSASGAGRPTDPRYRPPAAPRPAEAAPPARSRSAGVSPGPAPPGAGRSVGGSVPSRPVPSRGGERWFPQPREGGVSRSAHVKLELKQTNQNRNHVAFQTCAGLPFSPPPRTPLGGLPWTQTMFTVERARERDKDCPRCN